MTAKKSMTATKATEIEMLDEIWSLDGYLTDSLTADDLERMKTNIGNDFPIFMNTSIDQSGRIASLQGVNVGLEDHNRNLVHELEAKGNQILCLQSDFDGLYEIKKGMLKQAIISGQEQLFEDYCTPNEILRIKLEYDLDLTKEEKRALWSAIA